MEEKEGFKPDEKTENETKRSFAVTAEEISVLKTDFSPVLSESVRQQLDEGAETIEMTDTERKALSNLLWIYIDRLEKMRGEAFREEGKDVPENAWTRTSAKTAEGLREKVFEQGDTLD